MDIAIGKPRSDENVNRIKHVQKVTPLNGAIVWIRQSGLQKMWKSGRSFPGNRTMLTEN